MIPPIRALIVSVDYSDLLRLTLPYNRAHFTEVWIVTSTEDAPHVIPIADASDARVIVTDLFYDRGAEFAKFRAVEHALDVMGRHGWLCHLDADICWPRDALNRIAADGPPLDGSTLYGCLRRMLERPQDLALVSRNGIPPEGLWRRLRLHPGVTEWAGYTQLYHAEDPTLGNPPWHDTSWRHAGGGDSDFQRKWPANRKRLLPFECLHLGAAGANWFGRSTPLLDGSAPRPDAAELMQKTRDLWKERQRTGFEKEKLP